MDESYRYKTNLCALSECQLQGKTYRISILTERLIRLEYNENGLFEDGPTQKVVNRCFPVPAFRVLTQGDQLEILTECLQITYDGKAFSANGLSIRLNKCSYTNHSIWHYGDQGENLKGTARTLDEADGSIPLEDGLLSYSGYALLDDSASFILEEEGFVHRPIPGHMDLYFWGYGYDYLGCLKDFYHLCGATPMLPRFALGNWWSRYYAYTQEEYLKLMDRFDAEGYPFSVAVIDMDWHYVKLPERYGNGWTGYSWNKELFPRHQEMLAELHRRGMQISLNIHPADGVRGYEDAYPAMAKALGIDYEAEVPIAFDMAEERFVEAYFRYLHHPLEEEGVDFWWVDWQQGNTTRVRGLDPLWMLNHYYYLDNKRNGKRPLIFSRYAGIGSHRYPIGFSGDTIISWKSLEFQPYFTATASNAGYGWWSHDIGGHMRGYRDDELAVRWVQFGVFSPIMRLHSSCNVFSGKEPWNFGPLEQSIMKRYLRLRHSLLPYCYTMNARCCRESEPFLWPMYYRYPDHPEAYQVPNQYYFGSELMVHPITSRMDTQIRAGRVKTWLPEGVWYDLLTGLRYTGNRHIDMYRDLNSLPVLAKAGALIPMQQEATLSSITDNPKYMELLVFAGKSGEFVMYEDDGSTMEYKEEHYALTRYELCWEERKYLITHPAEGDLSSIPQHRHYRIRFYGIPELSIQSVEQNGQIINYSRSYDTEKGILSIELEDLGVRDTLEVVLYPQTQLVANQTAWRIYEALNRAQIEYHKKEMLYQRMTSSDSLEDILSELIAFEAPTPLKGLLLELILACRE